MAKEVEHPGSAGPTYSQLTCTPAVSREEAMGDMITVMMSRLRSAHVHITFLGDMGGQRGIAQNQIAMTPAMASARPKPVHAGLCCPRLFQHPCRFRRYPG